MSSFVSPCFTFTTQFGPNSVSSNLLCPLNLGLTRCLRLPSCLCLEVCLCLCLCLCLYLCLCLWLRRYQIQRPGQVYIASTVSVSASVSSFWRLCPCLHLPSFLHVQKNGLFKHHHCHCWWSWGRGMYSPEVQGVHTLESWSTTPRLLSNHRKERGREGFGGGRDAEKSGGGMGREEFQIFHLAPC